MDALKDDQSSGRKPAAMKAKDDANKASWRGLVTIMFGEMSKVGACTGHSWKTGGKPAMSKRPIPAF